MTLNVSDVSGMIQVGGIRVTNVASKINKGTGTVHHVRKSKKSTTKAHSKCARVSIQKKGDSHNFKKFLECFCKVLLCFSCLFR